ncbi:DUF1203 domain-containing protein [Sphingomonas sp. LB-2]|uniref:DUF1203 domain-containing protein n=1 Tax=Sphingomonas caeni TaxID=2984949 RepID=UPI00222F29B3|nr:DUF1203 domain-containing protein [Sphingomonas caeni]MCW3846076.1 DUF1203 domain-containing protein [Sphingomonas caeni]
MTYRISGLSPEPFRALFGASEEVLAEHGVRRVRATASRGFPCRITLEDAAEGETLLLLNHEDHAADTPFRSSYAIYVRECADEALVLDDALPPVFAGRPIAFRAFDAEGMLRGASLALADDADARLRELFDRPEIAYIHAHNAAHGCYSARVDRA